MLKTKKAAQRAANNLTCRSRNNMFKEKKHPKWFNEPPTTFLQRKTSSNSIQIKKTCNAKNRSQTKKLANAQPRCWRNHGHMRLSQIIYRLKRRTKKKHQSCLTKRGPSHKTNQTPRKNHNIEHVNVSRKQLQTWAFCKQSLCQNYSRDTSTKKSRSKNDSHKILFGKSMKTLVAATDTVRMSFFEITFCRCTKQCKRSFANHKLKSMVPTNEKS